MSSWNISNSSTKPTEPDYDFELASEEITSSGEEDKTSRIASQILQNISTPTLQLSSINIRRTHAGSSRNLGLDPSNLDDAELDELIKQLQSVQFERLQNKRPPMLKNKKSGTLEIQKDNTLLDLRTYLYKGDWKQFEALIKSAKQKFNNSTFADILDALKEALFLASRKAFGFALDKKGMDVIYDVLKNSLLLSEVAEYLLNHLTKEYSTHSSEIEQGIYYLLEKDNSDKALNLIGIRSKTIIRFLKLNKDIERILKSGPVFFLSHGPNAITYSGYIDDRKWFLEYLDSDKCSTDHLVDILHYAPKSAVLPDVLEILKNIAKHDQKKRSLDLHLSKHRNSIETQLLLDIIKAK